MNRRSGLAAVELLVVIVVLGIAAAVAVPALLRGSRNDRLFKCQAHLKALWDLDAAARAKGRPPKGTGGAYWTSIASEEVRRCPFSDSPYRGPAGDPATIASEAPLGADAPGSHGAGEGGNLLLKNGVIRACREGDGYWRLASERLAP
jgi:hypothetical protein